MRSIDNLARLKGRTALITGGAGHIGLAVGETLLELGAAVTVLDRSLRDCDRRVEQLLAGPGGDVRSEACDLMDEEATRAAVRQSVEAMGGLDILVHCAGYVGTTEVAGWAVPFDEQTVDAWDQAMRVNVTSAFTMVQEARQALARSGHGSVVFVSSIYGLVGPDLNLYEETEVAPSPAGFGASKAGLVQLARHLATILAPAVRINALTPGGVWRDQPEVFVSRYSGRTPLARMASEEDLKGAIAYLTSDLSQYVTGHNLVVDGGWTAL